MAQSKLPVRKIREVLRLKAERLSDRQIAAAIGSARSTAQECIRRCLEAGLAWPLAPELDEETLHVQLYCRNVPLSRTPAPDFAAPHAELERPGVTRMLLWQEYKAAQPDGWQCSEFCAQYRRWLGRQDVVLRQVHQPGDKLFVDYAGQSDPGVTAKDIRLFVEAVCGLLEPVPPGAICRRKGVRGTVCTNALPAGRGVWHRVFGELCEEADFEEVFMDSTIVRAHQHAAGVPKKTGPQALGRSRGRLTTKIPALVEGLGPLARWRLTAGQTHDVTQALELLDGITAASVAADKAYDADAVIEGIVRSGAHAVIPLEENRTVQRPYDKPLSRNHNLIGRFFCRLKQFRRIATRYDKLASRFWAFIALTASFIWLV